jgi:hypothetical protein
MEKLQHCIVKILLKILPHSAKPTNMKFTTKRNRKQNQRETHLQNIERVALG